MERMIGRHRGNLVAGTAFAILVLFLASVIGVFTVKDDSASARARILDPANAAPNDTSPIQPPIDLAPLISPAPPGFDRTTPEADGAQTKEQLAQGRGNAAGAMTLFDQLGLQGGFIRTWQRTGSDDLLALRLYQFGRVSGAKRYVDLGVEARTTPKSKRFDVPGVPGAIGIDAGPAEDGKHLAFVFVPKGRVVTVIAASLKEPPDLNVIAVLARSQVALLP
jgi:hypothetical protein